MRPVPGRFRALVLLGASESTPTVGNDALQGLDCPVEVPLLTRQGCADEC